MSTANLLATFAEEQRSDRIREQLLHSIEYHRIDEFTKLLKQNPMIDLDKKINHTNTLLHIVARLAKLDFVKVLIEHNASINVLNHENISVLYMTARYCSFEYTEGNEITYRTNYGRRSPNDTIMTMIQKYHDTIKYLLDHGADCKIPGYWGLSVLSQLVRRHYSGPEKYIIIQIVKLLLDYGTDRHLVSDNSVASRTTAEQEARSHHNIEIADCIKDYETLPVSKGCYDPADLMSV